MLRDAIEVNQQLSGRPSPQMSWRFDASNPRKVNKLIARASDAAVTRTMATLTNTFLRSLSVAIYPTCIDIGRLNARNQPNAF